MYPKFKPAYEQTELLEHFTLTIPEQRIIRKIVKDNNKVGFAIILKTYQYLGYVPSSKKDIPKEIMVYISNQLNLKASQFKNYAWKGRAFKYHISKVRGYLGYTAYDKTIFDIKLKENILSATEKALTKNNLYKYAIEKFKEIKMELPVKREFKKLVNFLYKLYFDRLYNNISNGQPKEVLINIDMILSSVEKDNNDYDQLKSNAGVLGVNTILNEIKKLRYINKFNINREILFDLNPKLIDKLYKRILPYDKSRVRDLKTDIKYSLFIVFLYVREKELIDNIVNTFLDLVKRMDNKSERATETKVIKEVKKVYGKKKILKNLTLAITENPQGNISDVVLPKVNLDTLNKLREEFLSDDEDDYHSIKAKNLKSRYIRHYRQMMKPILGILEFKSNNSSWNDILEAIKLIHRYIDTGHKYYPEDEDIPFDLISDKWKGLTLEKTKDDIIRVRKHYFELCVLEKFSKLLKCKEIYVYGSLKYRNPVDDLPKNWEKNREVYYRKLNVPLNKDEFINSVKKDLLGSLDEADSFFSKKRDVFIFQPKNMDRGFFSVPGLKKQEESELASIIKDRVTSQFKTIDLLDILIEADRHINFSKFFSTSAQRQILTDENIRERLLLNIFSLGTNIELKRIYNSASPNCEYDDLLYFRKRYMYPDALRNSTIALTNKIFEIRNPDIWGNSRACACDGKQFTSYEQNLMASSNPHYPKKGIMVYWHVDKNSTCIYSQLKHTNSSEVVSMIEGLIKHETEMKIEVSHTDSRGQSEVAFAFCHFLGIDLMPRFSKIKYKKLYIPYKNKEIHPNLKSVIERPVNWKLIESQYDEMVKHVIAIVNGSGSTESILRRFSSYNNTHPTYKAFRELGRAKKTIFLCNYLTDPILRREIHKALNIVESWNAVNSFISYGDRYEFNSNSPMIQEMTVLSLHLLQNALIFVNTILLDKIITTEGYLNKMSDRDFSSLTPLFTSNINPYGTFTLDFNKKSILEAA